MSFGLVRRAPTACCPYEVLLLAVVSDYSSGEEIAGRKRLRPLGPRDVIVPVRCGLGEGFR